jgi:hypothetical protein
VAEQLVRRHARLDQALEDLVAALGGGLVLAARLADPVSFVE